MIPLHVTSTNTHRKCNKALSGELIFSSHVLLAFAAEKSCCSTTYIKNTSLQGKFTLNISHVWHTGHLLAASPATILDFWLWAWNRSTSFQLEQLGFYCKMSLQYLIVQSQLVKYMTYTVLVRISHKTDHEGMWEQDLLKAQLCVFEGGKHQKVRSFSPSEEKLCSTACSDTSSSVDGFHLGLWSLSTSTGNKENYYSLIL